MKAQTFVQKIIREIRQWQYRRQVCGYTVKDRRNNRETFVQCRFLPWHVGSTRNDVLISNAVNAFFFYYQWWREIHARACGAKHGRTETHPVGLVRFLIYFLKNKNFFETYHFDFQGRLPRYNRYLELSFCGLLTVRFPTSLDDHAFIPIVVIESSKIFV